MSRVEAVPARNRSRTTSYGHGRYYRCGAAVLPLVAIRGTAAPAQRYYRWRHPYATSTKTSILQGKPELPKLLQMSSELSKLKLDGYSKKRQGRYA